MKDKSFPNYCAMTLILMAIMDRPGKDVIANCKLVEHVLVMEADCKRCIFTFFYDRQKHSTVSIYDLCVNKQERKRQSYERAAETEKMIGHCGV
jgi:hypothetical protein